MVSLLAEGSVTGGSCVAPTSACASQVKTSWPQRRATSSRRRGAYAEVNHGAPHREVWRRERRGQAPRS